MKQSFPTAGAWRVGRLRNRSGAYCEPRRLSLHAWYGFESDTGVRHDHLLTAIGRRPSVREGGHSSGCGSPLALNLCIISLDGIDLRLHRVLGTKEGVDLCLKAGLTTDEFENFARGDSCICHCWLYS
ncbi:hypothetical protein GOD62_28050 [Sinorhizobium medicae]|nr:hypothetical protein [Sinorhizobium medicae]MDX0759789.1 hypothetical protein [Sinorhizobium medicae]MDX0796474.1 hypothetical protein [Sinorhizobium medicae]